MDAFIKIVIMSSDSLSDKLPENGEEELKNMTRNLTVLRLHMTISDRFSDCHMTI